MGERKLQVRLTSPTLLYPSMTLCPGFQDKEEAGRESDDAVDTKLEDWLFSFTHQYEDVDGYKFYLTLS